jgi:hypothetical protein
MCCDYSTTWCLQTPRSRHCGKLQWQHQLVCKQTVAALTAAHNDCSKHNLVHKDARLKRKRLHHTLRICSIAWNFLSMLHAANPTLVTGSHCHPTVLTPQQQSTQHTLESPLSCGMQCVNCMAQVHSI